MKFIKHAFEKFDERTFTPEMAAKLMNGKHILKQSKSNPDRYLALGSVDGIAGWSCWKRTFTL